jgi:hypothetical protein
MDSRPVSRRDAHKILLSGAAAGLALPAIAGAQPGNAPKNNPTNRPGKTPAQPAPEPRSFLLDAMKQGKSRDWILKPTINVQAYQEDPARAPGDRPLVLTALTFQTAAILFPVIRGTGTSETDIDNVKSEVTFNDRLEPVKPEYNESYQSGVRLGRWELRDKTGKEVELKLEIPMTCWETVFDEKVAAKATWPAGNKWPRMAQATLSPQAKIDADQADTQAIGEVLKAWTLGKDPKSVSPLQLAKTLAGKCVESFQPTGSGELYSNVGAFVGLDLLGPAETIRRGAGSPHDIASVLVGAYRAAGLPARLVIGYDETERKGDDSSPFEKKSFGFTVRSWVEFCLFDETNNTELWVPVDPVRIRKQSSRTAPFDRPWKYFGTHDEMETLLPFAFHFIPPTTVMSYGYAFWGWFTTPRSQIGEHSVRFTAQTAPKRAQPKNPPQGKPKSK